MLEPDDEDSEMEDADAPPKPTFPPGTLKAVPQLLLGGSVTPAQDLSAVLKKSPNILIGTPGRLLELLRSPHVHCPQSSFDALVMDEADRLLDLGFKEDLQKIISRLPKQRRTGLFSASMSEAVDQLIRVGLRHWRGWENRGQTNTSKFTDVIPRHASLAQDTRHEEDIIIITATAAEVDTLSFDLLFSRLLPACPTRSSARLCDHSSARKASR
jgi:superfamily II DNA/RNA helicase